MDLTDDEKLILELWPMYEDVTGSSPTEACAVAAGVLSIQLDRASVWFKQAGEEGDDE